MNMATENKIDELVSESNSPLPLVKVFTNSSMSVELFG